MKPYSRDPTKWNKSKGIEDDLPPAVLADPGPVEELEGESPRESLQLALDRAGLAVTVRDLRREPEMGGLEGYRLRLGPGLAPASLKAAGARPVFALPSGTLWVDARYWRAVALGAIHGIKKEVE